MNAPDGVPVDALGIVRRVRSGRLTASAVVEHHLARIAEREPAIAAWQHHDPALAAAEARERDQRAVCGPLHGIPIGVKDLIDTADQATTYGSPIFAGHRPAADAAVVAALRAAGAVIMGKTVTPEFAVSGTLRDAVPAVKGFTPRVTINPLDPARTPGTSSSGSAAAVAAGMVPLALGTQTAGSVLAPASFCGILGFKPTAGRVPLDGIWVGSPSLDVVGLLARTVEDLAVGAGVLGDDPTGFDPDRSDAPERPRLGFARTEWSRVEPDTRVALEALVDRLGAVGRIREITLPDPFVDLTDAHEHVMRREIAGTHAKLLAAHADLMSPALRARLDPDLQPSEAQRRRALGLAVRCRNLLATVFSDLDALVTPVVPGEAPQDADMSASVFCRMWTLLGTPAVSVPVLRGPNGLPIGVQVVGPIGRDGATLATARWLAEHADG